jgi:hypothetical protein
VELRREFVHLARFALALNQLFAPALRDIQARGNPNRAPWFIDLFTRREVAFSQQDQSRLKQVCEYTYALLEWLDGVSRSYAGVSTQLFDFSCLTRPVDEKAFPLKEANCLNSVIQGLAQDESLKIQEVWARVCDRSARAGGSDSLTTLLTTLYDACATTQ